MQKWFNHKMAIINVNDTTTKYVRIREKLILFIK